MSEHRTNLFAVTDGPWGKLEYQLTTLEPPEDYIAITNSPTQTTWFFKGLTPAQARETLSKLGLSIAEQKAICDPKQWRLPAEGGVATPALTTLLALSPESRHKLYEFLAQFPENTAQREPFFWPRSQEAAQFENAPISSKTRALVQQLSFRHGDLVVFADLAAVASQISSPAERVALEKALRRQPAAFTKLSITPESDIEGLVRYWGVGGTSKYAEPGLEALSKLPEGRKASILGVLPPFARERLYMYPKPSDPAPLDGMWTAFNFFKDKPDPPTSDTSFWQRKLQSEYYPVFSDPRYGDVVLLTAPGGEVVQACIFLADNLVFAKTSERITVPWSVMRMDDLRAVASIVLPDGVAPQVLYFRSKSI